MLPSRAAAWVLVAASRFRRAMMYSALFPAFLLRLDSGLTLLTALFSFLALALPGRACGSFAASTFTLALARSFSVSCADVGTLCAPAN